MATDSIARMTIALLALLWVSAAPRYEATIAAGNLSDDPPSILDAVNGRVPFAPQHVHIEVVPAVPADTPVHWSSPDRKNEFDAAGLAPGGRRSVHYDATVTDDVAVYPREGSIGDAVLRADIGPPANIRVELAVRDWIAIGFGCYGFIRFGPSVRIIDGRPQRSTLADADVAVVGPGKRDGGFPGYGCWGDNADPEATSFKLAMPHGGRIATKSPNEQAPFVYALPYAEIESGSPLDVRADDGRVYRLHIDPAGGTYFTGWVEALDADGKPLAK